MKDLISVIVPVYNGEKKIIPLINCLKKQTYKKIEVLIINDGSTDDTENIVNSLIIDDDRFILINKKNGGASSARNLGIKKSKGKYIAFADADDKMDIDALRIMHNVMSKDDVDLVVGNYYIPQTNKKGNATNKLINNHELFQCKIYNKKYEDNDDSIGNPRTVWGKLYKSEIIKDNSILFNENIKLFEDGVFNLQYTAHANIIRIIDNIVYIYK